MLLVPVTPRLKAYSPGAVTWTDTINASSNLDKSISVGTQYTEGVFWVRGVNGWGVSAGPANVNGLSGKIRQSSSSGDYSWAAQMAGVYSSTYSRAVDSSLSARIFNSSASFSTIALIDVWFDGSGNVVFRWNNNDAGASRAMSVRAAVLVYG